MKPTFQKKMELLIAAYGEEELDVKKDSNSLELLKAYDNEVVCNCEAENARKLVYCAHCGSSQPVYMSEIQRKSKCEAHRVRAFNCGALHFFCQNCMFEGWESNAGKGGSCQLRNQYTKETKEPFWNVDCFY